MPKKKNKSIEEEILENRKTKKEEQENIEVDIVKPKLKHRVFSFNKTFDNLKIKYKKDPKKFIVLAASILVAFSLVIGSSYAYLTYISKTNSITTIEAGTLALNFKNETNSISLNNALPIKDEEGLEGKEEYEFTIENTGSLPASYVITLDNTCVAGKSYTIDGTSINADICIPINYIKVGLKEGSSNYKVLEYNESESQYIIDAGSLNSNGTKTYKMKLWLDYDTPNDYNSHGTLDVIFSAKLGLSYEQGVANLDTSGANEPVLDEGMIAVYYDDKSCSTIDSTSMNIEDYPTCYSLSPTILDENFYNYCISYLENDSYSNEEAASICGNNYLPETYYILEGVLSSYYSENNQLTNISDEAAELIYNDYGYTKEEALTSYDALFDCLDLYSVNPIIQQEYKYNKNNTFSVTKKADSANMNKDYQWYDYNKKMWANSVTVTETNRTTYLSAEPGTEIAMDDILTMQVWIPRYKYKVWNYNADGTVTSEPQEIEIVFESGTSSTGEITCTDTISGTDGAASETCQVNGTTCTNSTCNNNYYTHPAFTFGEEEVEGFWIGKFELTGTIDNITTKPNLSSLRNQNVSTFATNIMAMNDSGNQYGFNTSTDTHMIKNMEWGAVAYLSHSKYGTCTNGVCTEIGINNNSNYITGCGAEAGSSSSTACNSYETELGQSASTTGNIYGVYDMSGGAYDYTMGNIVSPDGVTMMSGYSTGSNSGYTGIVYKSGDYEIHQGQYTYPDAKYYDKYSFETSSSQRIRSKLGDGIKEVLNTSSESWYSDYSELAYSDNPWFGRSGIYNNGSSAGAFRSVGSSGFAFTNRSSRLVITP